ncbi:MAG: hemolysin III family protein [Firmicutes bacterium]|nr:hemolysin III family protein [Bacillota bacterium]
MNEAPLRSVKEEIGNAITHGVGAVWGIVALILMLVHAPIHKAPKSLALTASLVYGLCLILLFTISCLYHSFRWGSRVKRVFRRFDYSSIYLLIGGTFAPFFLIYWGDTKGILLFALQWAIIVTGVTLIGVFGPARFRALHMALYVAIGWSGLMFLPQLSSQTPPLFWHTLMGGVIYTLGILPFALKAKGSHFIWHFFVLVGALCQWIGIYRYIYLA